MHALQKVEIDWDIHKLIEAERSSFSEAPYIALRRLLKLPPPSTLPVTETQSVSAGAAWIDDGVTVPHGSLARMEYGRGSQVFEGQFINGKLVVNGRSFDKLSAAANALAITKSGKRTSLNGWNYWKAKFPGEARWQLLNDLRHP